MSDTATTWLPTPGDICLPKHHRGYVAHVMQAEDDKVVFIQVVNNKPNDTAVTNRLSTFLERFELLRPAPLQDAPQGEAGE